MAITATCTGCGKQLKVKDELVGKRIKCPGCGQTFAASASSAVAPPPTVMGQSRQRPAAKGSEREGGPSIHIEAKWIVLGILAVFLLASTTLYYVFPKAVADQWDAQEKRASDDVEEVVQYLVQADNSRDDWEGGLAKPTVHSVTFLFGPMHWSMPEDVGFLAVTNGGKSTGVYHPRTGEISVDIQEGGLVLPTGVLMHEGKVKIHGTGRVKEGKPSGEIDGRAVTIRQPTTREYEAWRERQGRR